MDASAQLRRLCLLSRGLSPYENLSKQFSACQHASNCFNKFSHLLLCTEYPIPCIPQARNDVAVFIEAFVHGPDQDVHIRVIGFQFV